MKALFPHSMAGWYRLQLLVIDLPWYALWFWLAWRGQVPTLVALLAGPGLLLALRVLMVRNTFRNARRLGIQRPELDPAARRRLFWGEALSFWRMFLCLMPFSGTVRADGNGVPIICVHGIICSSGVWSPLVRWLAAQGEGPIETISLYPPFASVENFAEQLHAKIEDTCQRYKAQQVRLVGHSMGGLVSRCYLHRHGGARIERVITLGSPHHGAIVARTMTKLGRNIVELRYKSDWLAGLNAHQAQPCPAPITSIWSPHDNVVLPQDSAVLRYPNARNIELPGYGHDALLFAQPVWQLVLRELRG